MKRLYFYSLIFLLSLVFSDILNAQTTPVFKIKFYQERGFYGIIDSSSNKLIKALKYDEVLDFDNKLARVRLNSSWGLIDTKGIEVTEIIYDEIKEFSSGMAVVKLNSKYGAINTLGKEVTGLKYDYVSDFLGNISMVTTKEGHGYINKNGVELCPLKYDDADLTSISSTYKDVKLFRVKYYGLYGYLDSSGKEIVPCQYDNAPEGYRFTVGMTAVSKNGKWGAINEQGTIIIPMQYEELGDFYEGLIRFKNNGKYGYLDKVGKIVIQPLYDYIGRYFVNGITDFSLNGKYGIVDKTGKVVAPALYDNSETIFGGYVKVEQNGKYGIINKINSVVIPIKYDRIEYEIIKDKVYFRVTNDNEDQYKHFRSFNRGLFDQTGKMIVPVQYAGVWPDENCIVVAVNNDTSPEKMNYMYNGFNNYGIYSYAGQVLVQAEYYDYEHNNGVYTLKTREKTGMFFSKTNKTIAPHDLLVVIDSFYYANNGGTVDENGIISGGKYSMFDPKGNRVTTVEYDYITAMVENLCFVTLNGKMGFIDKTGKVAIDLKYDFIIEGKFSDGMAAVNIGGTTDPENGFIGGKWGYINKTGEMVIPAMYDGAALFKSGMAAVIKDNLFGAIDKTGKLIIPFEYQHIGLFENAIALFVKDNMYGFLDKTGKIIVSNIYQGAYDFSEGLAAVSLNNKIGFIDETGKVVIPIQYDGVDSFENGYARVMKDNMIFLLDKKGTVIKQSAMQ